MIERVTKLIEEHNIAYVALQYVDLFGKIYQLWIPSSALETASERGVSVSGWPYFGTLERSDVILRPDLSSFRLLPWRKGKSPAAGVMCDIYRPETNEEVRESPRYLLKKAVRKLKDVLGEEVCVHVAPELEFFLLMRDENGCLLFHDTGSYFSPPPADKGYELRENICLCLKTMGIEVEKSHHEVPRGKHEINIKHDEALNMADKVQFFKLLVRKLAADQGLIASFMPKPFDWEFGAGWHTHISLVDEKKKQNLLYSSGTKHGLSKLGTHFMAGILKHAKALAAVTNPTVNSYKRLRPGSQAPIYIAWSKYNRSALLRIPAATPQGTRFEYRASDGSCNVYLSFAALIYAGLDGVLNEDQLPPPVESNIYKLTEKERSRMGIGKLPSNLAEALVELENDEVIKEALDPLTPKYLAAKWREWNEYSYKVHEWEREIYLEESYPYMEV